MVKRLIHLLIIILLTIFLTNVQNLNQNIEQYIKIIPSYIYIFLMLLTIYTWVFSLNNNLVLNFLVIIYPLFLIINLYFRIPFNKQSISTDFYLKEWLKILLTNKIVFINLVGNIILFIPLGYILNTLNINKIIKILIGISLIFLLELIQFFTKLGIFDIIDIILNTIGIIIGLFIKRSIVWMKKTKTKKN